MFSRQLHITPEALPEAQVEIDKLLEPLSKGARAALKNLKEKQAFPSNTVTGRTEPAGETKTAFDKKHISMPMQDLSKNVLRKHISVTLSEELDSRRELDDVAQERVHTETKLHVIPKHVTYAVNGEKDISSSSAKTGRSAKHWRRLALLC